MTIGLLSSSMQEKKLNHEKRKPDLDRYISRFPLNKAANLFYRFNTSPDRLTYT
jgi:hypothetical protein